MKYLSYLNNRRIQHEKQLEETCNRCSVYDDGSKMLDRASVLWWNEVQKDLYTDKDGRTFGVELDLFNNHMSFYIRNPDGGEIPIFTNNVYQAIDVFNHLTKEN